MHPSTSTATRDALAAPTPFVVGRPVVGETLDADVSAWPPGTAFGFQWYANDAAIDGANEPRLAVNHKLLYRSVSVTVYASVPRQPTTATRSAASRLVTSGA